MKVILAIFFVFGIISCNKSNIATSPDNTIESITICNQVWQKKNLDVSYYRNGDVIPQVTDSIVWSNLSTGAWCWYMNDSATYASTYGKLYNWYAVNDPRGLAPTGWHIPTETEWVKLIDTCLGGYLNAGSKMKEIGVSHWISPNTGANDSTGFTALPGGFRAYFGQFQFLGYYGYWWTSTEYGAISAGFRYLNYSMKSMGAHAGSSSNITFKKGGHSVRCVRD